MCQRARGNGSAVGGETKCIPQLFLCPERGETRLPDHVVDERGDAAQTDAGRFTDLAEVREAVVHLFGVLVLLPEDKAGACSSSSLALYLAPEAVTDPRGATRSAGWVSRLIGEDEIGGILGRWLACPGRAEMPQLRTELMRASGLVARTSRVRLPVTKASMYTFERRSSRWRSTSSAQISGNTWCRYNKGVKGGGIPRTRKFSQFLLGRPECRDQQPPAERS